MVGGLLIVWLIILTTYLMVKRLYENYKYPKIPGPSGLPLIGNALQFWDKPEAVFKQLYSISNQYTRMVGLWIGPKLHVAIFDPRDAEVILRANRHQVQKAEEYRFLRPWLGESILISKGEKFKKNKKFIMPAFNVNVLKNFLVTFNAHSRHMASKLYEQVGKDEFDIHDILSAEALNVLLETSMGVNCETLGDNAVRYAHAVEKVCKIVHIRAYTLWLRPDILFNYSKLKKKQDECLQIIHPLTESVIKKRKEELIQQKEIQSETGESNARRKAVVLDLLLEAEHDGERFSDQEIMDEILTMMFAGQDTTAGTTGFALSLLGLYKRHQKKIHEELDEIFGDSDRDVTYEDIGRMEYMERCILETLRLYPAIPMIGRKPIQDLKLEDGYILPKNCTVGLIIMKIHRNPDYYEKPHYFNPDNFLPENVKQRHPYSFIPFSAGTRTCIGPKYAMLKIKVVLSHILRKYNVTSTVKEIDWKLSGQTTLKRKDGFRIRIEPRKTIYNNNNEIIVNKTDAKSNLITLTEKLIETVEETNNELNSKSSISTNDIIKEKIR